MNDGYVRIEDRETDRIAKQLSKAIARSDEYTAYRSALEELQLKPELYEQVNSLRRQNFLSQNGEDGIMPYEEYQKLSVMSRNLRVNPLVSRFLDAEV